MKVLEIPTNGEIPSAKQLIKSTLIAIFGAGVIFAAVILPAEYGIDPTGFGKISGLKEMGDIKMSLINETNARKAAEETARASYSEYIVEEPANTEIKNDEFSIILAPNEGREIKAVMKKGNKMQFSWKAEGGEVFYDYHADSQKENIEYKYYGKGKKSADSGELIAEFEGNHGWFWRNRNKTPVTIKLTTTGDYSDISQLD